MKWHLQRDTFGSATNEWLKGDEAMQKKTKTKKTQTSIISGHIFSWFILSQAHPHTHWCKACCWTTPSIGIWATDFNALRFGGFDRISTPLFLPTAQNHFCEHNGQREQWKPHKAYLTYDTRQCSRPSRLRSQVLHRSATSWGHTGRCGRQSPVPRMSSSLQWRQD